MEPENTTLEKEKTDSAPVTFHLGEDFYAVEIEAVYGDALVPEFGPTPLSRTYELKRGERTVCTKNDPADGTLLQKSVAGLQDFFKAELIQEFGGSEGHFNHLQRTTSVSQEVLPPWERIKSCRTLNKQFFTFTDDGNAFRFQAECGDWFVYDSASRQWYVWMENHYEPANKKEILAARFVGRSVAPEEPNWIDHDGCVPTEFYRHVKHSGSLAGAVAMLKFAAPAMSVDFSEKSNTDLVAFKNGVLDAKTGKIYEPWEYPSLKSQYPTVYIPQTYTPGKRSQVWEDELKLLMTDDKLEPAVRAAQAAEKAEYLKSLIGYSLYGGNPARRFVFFFGTGRNGKSVISDVLAEVYGDEFGRAALSQIYSGNADRPSPTLVQALPKRIAVFPEADGESGRLSSSALKDIASGEKETMRFRLMHQNNRKTKLNCLPVAVTNVLPEFDRPLGKAELDRIDTVEFCHEFTQDNAGIKDALIAEGDAIFSTAVDYLLKYLKEGQLPRAPVCMKAEQLAFLIGSDMLSFLRENYELKDAKYFTPRRELVTRYQEYCEANGVEYRTKKSPNGLVLSDLEARKLYGACKMLGYEEGIVSGGVRGFKGMHQK
ncbi:MAG TPA: hypothetical protein O0X70_02000 [Methanocorpusculum sp.]|nr:hypothetical protein [Methanocorpusculum sp.]